MTRFRMTRRYLVVMLAAMAPLAGCAGYRHEPLTMSHPAHPDGPAAPVTPASGTLAYGLADVPSARPAAPATTAGTRVVGVGEVVAMVPNADQLVIDHEVIPGFMEAMTMGYRVEPPSLLGGVQEGDRIRFTIDVRRRAIVEIEKLQ